MNITYTHATGIFLCLLGLIVIFTAHGYIIRCERSTSSSITCKITHFGLLFRKTTVIPSGHLQAAQVELQRYFGIPFYFRIVLVTKNKNIYLISQGSDNGDRCDDVMQEKVDKINQFINDSNQKSLRIEESVFSSMLITGGSFLIFGLIMIFFIANYASS